MRLPGRARFASLARSAVCEVAAVSVNSVNADVRGGEEEKEEEEGDGWAPLAREARRDSELKVERLCGHRRLTESRQERPPQTLHPDFQPVTVADGPRGHGLSL